MAPPYPWKRTLIALFLFGTAFGYLEAAVVCYLRLLHQPAREHYHPGISSADLFPLLTLDQLRESPNQKQTLVIELGREAATIVMLAAIAVAVAQNLGQWAAAFVIAFGVWDITFYIFLKLLLDWPASIFTWDILFLVPVPWVGPVLAPSLVSLVMILAGVWHLRCEGRGNCVSLRRLHWFGVFAGALVIVYSFAMDYEHVMRGGMPNPFHWGIFTAGLALGTVSYAIAAIPTRPSRSR